jgi:hypothetical protein
VSTPGPLPPNPLPPMRQLASTAFAARDPAAQERWRDNEHLRLLSIFHFVIGGLALLMLPLLVMHFLFFITVVANANAWPQGHAPPAPRDIVGPMIAMYCVVALMAFTLAGINILSVWFLRRKTHRVFSLVVAGLDCLQMPYGTVLGVFTILVLTRPSVQSMYETSPRS